MCGIAGTINHADAPNLTRTVTQALSHRGPDSEGFHDSPRCSLGHRRLAILDLSTRGVQPMTSRDGRWTLVLNGEIFNYRDLARELPGTAWRSSTDTEVLLETIAHHGFESTLRRTIGMFALAAWDHGNETLWLARDRMGEKPLVYYWDGRVLAFASELGALAPFHENLLDAGAVDLYFAFGYVPAPHAIYRRTFKLPAGYLLRFRPGASSPAPSAELEVRRWWFPERLVAPLGRTTEDLESQLRDLVEDAVRLRLHADVPIALALSGGIDSTIIAGEMARQRVSCEAFTVSFDGDESRAESDTSYARHVAQRLGLRHEVIPARADLGDALSRYDEPFADSSSVPTLALARALDGRYKVILNGDGGDEAFGGYRHYEHIKAKQTIKRIAAVVARGAAANVYVQSKATFRTPERTRLLNGHSAEANGTLDRFLAADPYLRTSRAGALKHALWSDRHLYLANNLTYKMDMAMGACGLEGRAPLLDHRILEWAQNLPDHELVRGRQKKVLLRRAYRDVLPPEVAARTKQGFGSPVEAWLKGPLREQVQAALPCPLLDAAAQTNLSGQRLWTAFVFSRWAERWGARW